MARNVHERRRARDRVEVTRVPVPDEAVKLAGLPAADRPDAFALALPDGASQDARTWHARLAAVAAPRWIARLAGVRSVLARALRLKTACPCGAERPVRGDLGGAGRGRDGAGRQAPGLPRGHPGGGGPPGRRESAPTTVVQPHNRTVRAYFALIRPFHLLIVPGILRRVAR